MGLGQPFNETGLPSLRGVRHVEIGVPFWRRPRRCPVIPWVTNPPATSMNLDTPGRLSVFPKDLLSAETTKLLRAKAMSPRQRDQRLAYRERCETGREPSPAPRSRELGSQNGS